MLKIPIQQQTVDLNQQINEQKFSAVVSIVEGNDPGTPNNFKAAEICNGYDINCGDDDDDLLLLGDRQNKQKLKNSKTVDKQLHAEQIENENSEADNNFIVDEQDSESDYHESNLIGQNLQDKKKTQQKKLSKIEEDEFGDEEGNETRFDDKKIVRKQQEDDFDNELNVSLLRVEDEYTSESEEQELPIIQQPAQNLTKDLNNKQASIANPKDNEKNQINQQNQDNNNGKISISAGLSQMSPEDLAKLKLIMGANLKALKINQPEDAIPLSAHHKYLNEDDIMKKKLKNLQKMEAERQKNALEEYQRNEDKMNKKVKILGSGENKAGGIEGEGEGIAENDSMDSEQRLLKEEIEGGFDPKDLQEQCDGWEIFKRKRIPTTMVRRYCQTLDQDYTKNKITVCAHANHIYDMYHNQRRPFMRTYADHMEKS